MELSKSKFNVYSSLGSAKMRRKHGLFTVEGEKSVSDTLGLFDAEAVICLKEKAESFARCACNLYVVTEPEMRKLSNLSTPSSAMAIYRLPESGHDDDIRVPADRLYMVLDGVQDPGNLGTIIRTCHWFGIYRIFASHDTVDVFNPKTIQSTMGSVAKVRVDYVDLASLFEANRNLPVYGTLLEGKDIFKAELSACGFILMGNEGKGISPALRTFITDPLLIPPAGPDHSESLNVAIAAAVTIAQFRK